MPKNKGKGGKNRRRGKNENDNEKRELTFKEDGQEYAQVVKMLGYVNCRLPPCRPNPEQNNQTPLPNTTSLATCVLTSLQKWPPGGAMLRRHPQTRQHPRQASQEGLDQPGRYHPAVAA